MLDKIVGCQREIAAQWADALAAVPAEHDNWRKCHLTNSFKVGEGP